MAYLFLGWFKWGGQSHGHVMFCMHVVLCYVYWIVNTFFIRLCVDSYPKMNCEISDVFASENPHFWSGTVATGRTWHYNELQEQCTTYCCNPDDTRSTTYATVLLIPLMVSPDYTELGTSIRIVPLARSMACCEVYYICRHILLGTEDINSLASAPNPSQRT